MEKIRHFNRISKREHQVLERLSRGKVHKQIADDLNISPATASTHVKNCMRKLNTNKETELVYRYTCLKHGIIDFT